LAERDWSDKKGTKVERRKIKESNSAIIHMYKKIPCVTNLNKPKCHLIFFLLQNCRRVGKNSSCLVRLIQWEGEGFEKEYKRVNMV
jgi:hypothetical protein